MKKILLLLTLTLVTTSLFAQTENGRYLIGANSNFQFNFNTNKIKSDDFDVELSKTFDVGLSPMVGYFIADNFSLGLSVPIQYSNIKSNDVFVGNNPFPSELTQNFTSIALAPFTRYYFSNNNIKPFLGASIGLGKRFSSTEILGGPEISESKSTENLFTYNINGGIAIFINQFIAIDLGLGYYYDSAKDSDSSDNTRVINSNIGFNAGFTLFLGDSNNEED